MAKISSVAKLRQFKNIEDLPADMIGQELRTKGNTLSVWKFDSEEGREDAIKAALLATSSIEKTILLIIDDDQLNHYDIFRDDKEKGCTGYKGKSDLHVNLCELTYRKIGNILHIYHEIATKDEYKNSIISFDKEQVKRLELEMYRNNLIDMENINQDLLEDIEKYYFTTECQKNS